MKNRNVSIWVAQCLRLTLSSIFLFLLIFLYSCDNKSDIANNQINVEEVVGSGAVLKLSDYASDIQYIPLETNEKSILGNIRDIAYEAEKIYVLDNKNVIKLFDNTGKYLSTIDRSGRGPEEYNRIVSFVPAPHSNGVYIMDSSGDLFLYDQDGAFIEKKSLPKEEKIKVSSFLFMDTCILTAAYSMNMKDLSGNIDHNIFLYNNSLNIIDTKSFSQEGGIVTTMNGGAIASITISIRPIYVHKYANQARFLFDGDDTIYTVNKEGVFKDAYVFNYGKYRHNDQEPDLITPIAESKFIKISPPFFETENYLYLVFDFGENAPEKIESNSKSVNGNLMSQIDTRVNAVFDKKSGKLKLLNRPTPEKRGFVEDIKGGLPFWPAFMNSTGELISYSNAFDIIDTVESDSLSSSFIKGIAAKLTEDDNPVVVIVKPKK